MHYSLDVKFIAGFEQVVWSVPVVHGHLAMQRRGERTKQIHLPSRGYVLAKYQQQSSVPQVNTQTLYIMMLLNGRSCDGIANTVLGVGERVTLRGLAYSRGRMTRGFDFGL